MFIIGIAGARAVPRLAMGGGGGEQNTVHAQHERKARSPLRPAVWGPLQGLEALRSLYSLAGRPKGGGGVRPHPPFGRCFFFFLLVREVGNVRWVPLLCVRKI